MSSICRFPRPQKEQGWGSAKGSDERPASTYDHGDCVYMTATRRGVCILAASQILSLSLSQRFRLQGVPVLMSNRRDCMKRPTRRSTLLMSKGKANGGTSWNNSKLPSSTLRRCVHLCRFVYYLFMVRSQVYRVVPASLVLLASFSLSPFKCLFS
jgi:hypothetical protein